MLPMSGQSDELTQRTSAPTEPRFAGPHRSVANTRAIWWVLGGLLAANALIAVALPGRPDEVTWYLPVVEHSGAVWPALNTEVVGQGISPLYSWLVGGIVATGAPALLVGRLVSLAAATCAAVLVGRRLGVVAVLPLAAYSLALFSARVHPIWPAVLVLVLAFLTRRRWGQVVLVAIAVNLQPSLAPLALGLAIVVVAESTRRRLVDWAVWLGAFGLAAGAGIVATWAVYGGQYTEEFLETFPEARDFDGVTVAYAPLVALTAGVLLLVVLPTLRMPRGWSNWLAVGAAGAAMAVVAVLAPMPVGPLGRVLGALGGLGSVAYGAMVALATGLLVAGLLGLWREQGPAGQVADPWRVIALVATLVAGFTVLSQLPWLYERYATFVVAPAVALLMGPVMAGRSRGRHVAIAGVLALSAVGMSLVGSL
ncbi:hypothetical protein Lsed01_00648 [Demequina sediminis]|uniref:Glycosyltransferase RgtA/B/C/D-like domain-containing protein n=1 Tax=Demequina sediminis TaxID=1930058 RepID=A0ABP9WEF6_9MICO